MRPVRGQSSEGPLADKFHTLKFFYFLFKVRRTLNICQTINKYLFFIWFHAFKFESYNLSIFLSMIKIKLNYQIHNGEVFSREYESQATQRLF